MIKSIKKLFDWTPRDVAAWEKIRQPGLWHFVLWYGVKGFGLILFIVMGGVTVIRWLLALASFASLILQLAVVAGVCLLGGLVTGFLIWWLEDGIYKKIIKSRSS